MPSAKDSEWETNGPKASSFPAYRMKNEYGENQENVMHMRERQKWCVFHTTKQIHIVFICFPLMHMKNSMQIQLTVYLFISFLFIEFVFSSLFPM